MISVIIPTYNEAIYLPATLDSVADSNTNKEVIVVDAGSADGTSDLARARGARVLLSQRQQRAYQMNPAPAMHTAPCCCSSMQILFCLPQRSIISHRLYRRTELSAADSPDGTIQIRCSYERPVYSPICLRDGRGVF